MKIIEKLRDLLGWPPATDDKSGNWHKISRPFFPVRLIDGAFSDPCVGQLWRRWNGDRWEYQQDEETKEEFDSRAW